MATISQIWTWSCVCIATLCVSCASWGWARVVVFDRVTTSQTPVYLRVQTKGRFFTQGGKLVDIYINDQKLNRILTGGDGYGYLKYIPQRVGMIKFEARADGDRETGIILVIGENEKVILIEVESGFKDTLLSNTTRVGSRKAIETLSQKYKIVYLSTFFGTNLAKKWLVTQQFPESATLQWQGSKLLTSLQEKGIQLHAIIGSAALISEATRHIARRYTFEESKEGQTVADWEQLIELIDKPIPQLPP